MADGGRGFAVFLLVCWLGRPHPGPYPEGEGILPGCCFLRWVDGGVFGGGGGLVVLCRLAGGGYNRAWELGVGIFWARGALFEDGDGIQL